VMDASCVCACHILLNTSHHTGRRDSLSRSHAPNWHLFHLASVSSALDPATFPLSQPSTTKKNGSCLFHIHARTHTHTRVFVCVRCITSCAYVFVCCIDCVCIWSRGLLQGRATMSLSLLDTFYMCVYTACSSVFVSYHVTVYSSHSFLLLLLRFIFNKHPQIQRISLHLH